MSVDQNTGNTVAHGGINRAVAGAVPAVTLPAAKPPAGTKVDPLNLGNNSCPCNGEFTLKFNVQKKHEYNVTQSTPVWYEWNGKKSGKKARIQCHTKYTSMIRMKQKKIMEKNSEKNNEKKIKLPGLFFYGNKVFHITANFRSSLWEGHYAYAKIVNSRVTDVQANFA